MCSSRTEETPSAREPFQPLPATPHKLTQPDATALLAPDGDPALRARVEQVDPPIGASAAASCTVRADVPHLAASTPLKPLLRTTKRAAALNAIPAIVTADVLDVDDSPMLRRGAVAGSCPSPPGLKPVGRKRRIADVQAGGSVCDGAAPRVKKRAPLKKKFAAFLGGKDSRNKGPRGAKGKKRRGIAQGVGSVVHTGLEGGEEDPVCHTHGFSVWVAEALPEPSDSPPDGEFWPYESLLCAWSECDSFQFNA